MKRNPERTQTMTPNKPNAYEAITEKIIAALEAGTAPWRKPWTHAGAARSIDGRTYRGINQFLLQLAPFETPVFLTYRKAETLGGHVRKGEKGLPVVFWKTFENEETEAEKARRGVLLRYYHVFNVSQIEGIPEEKLPEVETFAHDPIPEASAIIQNMPNAPKIQKGARACYCPATDCVTIPSLTRYEIAEEYYSTLFHELAHSTGHKTRLDRKGIEGAPAPFGSPDYSREELVAEMTAAFLCGACGIAPATLDNSAAYVAGWIKVLKADSKAAIIAAAQAQKAADYIRAIAPPTEATE